MPLSRRNAAGSSALPTSIYSKNRTDWKSPPKKKSPAKKILAGEREDGTNSGFRLKRWL